MSKSKVIHSVEPDRRLIKYNYKVRRDTLLVTKPYFRKYGPTCDPVMAGMINRKSKISLHHKFAFFRIPKAASSTSIKTLYMHENRVSADDFDKRVAMKSYTSLSELSQMQVKELERNFFKFTIVRNPWCRLASVYLDKIADEEGSPPKPQSKRVAEYYKRRYGAYISFTEFCNYLRFGGLNANPHWTPQSAMSSHPLSKMDYIGKVETLESDLAHIIEQLFQISANNAAVHSNLDNQTLANSRLHELYDPYTTNLARELYRADFENFGYDMSEVNSAVGDKPK